MKIYLIKILFIIFIYQSFYILNLYIYIFIYCLICLIRDYKILLKLKLYILYITYYVLHVDYVYYYM